MSALFPRRARDPLVERMLSVAGNQVGVRGTDSRGDGVVLSTVFAGTLTPERRALLARAGTHIAAGHRLRRSLAGRSWREAAEAVFDAAGRLEHVAVRDDWRAEAAADAAVAGRRRAADDVDLLARTLTDRARRVRDAVGPLRRASPARALELWRGLFDGRWSLVAHADSDGKRFLVAMRNPPGVHDQAALGRRERQVAQLLIDGCSLKQVSYELGLAPSTVSGHVKTTLRKLRLGDVGELVALGQHLGGPGAHAATGRASGPKPTKTTKPTNPTKPTKPKR
jgi:DNA-binding CsgD family transcriptional regulator